MTDTTTLASDANKPLTAARIAARLDGIAKLLGPVAYVSASVTAGSVGTKIAHVGVYPDDIICGSTAVHFNAPTFAEAIAQAEAWVAGRGAILRDNAIRKMALDIIDLTDQHGSCTKAMLLGRKHSSAQIADLTDAACARAAEMSGNAPFSVEA